jgi:hypothetical protein
LAWLLADDMRAGGIGEAHRGGSVETASPGTGPTILAADTSLSGEVRLGIAARDSAMSRRPRRKELCSINQK